jgi:hypothetical protein
MNSWSRIGFAQAGGDRRIEHAQAGHADALPQPIYR